MYDTPIKGILYKNSSLREKIQNKLSTDKKIEDQKQIFKKYQTNIKNSHPSNLVQRSISSSVKSLYNSNKICTQNLHKTECINSKFEPQITQQNILEYQSLQNQNFFGFEEWIQFNKKFFNHVDANVIKALWKIIRTINYGDILIPSGLIFQVTNGLSRGNNNKISSLKQIFNKFLEINNVTDRVSNFRELKNYPTLEEIQNSYLNRKEVQRNTNLSKNKLYSSLKKTNESKDVFQRNYENSKQRDQVKSRNIYKSLLQKQYDPECVFKPQINEYCPKKLFIDQTQRHERGCHSNDKWMIELLKENDLSQTYNFKASPFQRSRFQNQIIEDIPGVTQHIDRRRYSEAKKRKIQRYMQKPTLVFRND